MKKRLLINYYGQRRFTCKQCSQTVITVAGVLDKRTKFCSYLCSRRYWRHASKYRKMQ
ncbi:hypothetical protein [Streptococcus acidominimus]|uniref:Uncharacterized protein n=1 Tax=Streptococcus acidominimus TaxID=1326 RepID=A0A380IF40_STRAI|nr:hypothetical protein [Streptococcus acidominimus]MBF0845990.1 hypothetical protein [Streptococcus danieliae]MBF0819636.1 hypothetical protein [Streptococcus acidominimus]MBF0819728.1 hypothetical protein [Streptococcus acidominimus]MBF0819802.1 hypothetical protein [Streptococcus acidominimus]MBF0838176.1 hypothetical protein [Streptococcus acidominimus]